MPQGESRRVYELSFSLISEAWDVIKNNMAVYVLGTLIWLVVIYGVSLVLQLPLMTNTRGMADDPLFMYKSPLYWLANFLSMILSILMMASLTKAALKDFRGEKAEFGDLFSIFSDGLGAVIIAGLLITIGTYIGALFCVLPGIAFYILTIVAVPAIIDQKLSAVDAIKWSIEKVKSHFWITLGLIIVTGILAGLGVIACCIGILWSYPILPIVIALMYVFFKGGSLDGMVASNTNYPRDPGSFSGGMPETPEAPREFSWPGATTGAVIGGVASTTEPPAPDAPTHQVETSIPEAPAPTEWPSATAPEEPPSGLSWPSEQESPTEPAPSAWPSAEPPISPPDMAPPSDPGPPPDHRTD